MCLTNESPLSRLVGTMEQAMETEITSILGTLLFVVGFLENSFRTRPPRPWGFQENPDTGHPLTPPVLGKALAVHGRE